MGARPHQREAGRDGRSAGCPPTASVVARRLTDESAKRGAERAETPETDLEAHLGDGQSGAPQEFLGALDPAPPEVLMRGFAEGPFEAADEMRPGRVRLAGECWDVEPSRVVAVHQILCASKVDVDRNRVAHRPRG